MIKPLFDRVLLEPESMQESDSGILVPRTDSDRCHTMTVIAVGDECKPIFLVGDRVILHKWAGTRLPDNDFVIAKQCDILAVIGGAQ